MKGGGFAGEICVAGGGFATKRDEDVQVCPTTLDVHTCHRYICSVQQIASAGLRENDFKAGIFAAHEKKRHKKKVTA